MKISRFVVLIFLALIVTGDDSRAEDQKKTGNVSTSKAAAEKLLGRRIGGGLGESFRGFSNMFFVQSRIKLGSGVGLMTSDKEIMQKNLMPVFPEAYQPTLRELLDAIAVQTSSSWKHDTSGEYVEKGIENVTIFEFSPSKHEKPYTIELADGWKSRDMGCWVMCKPEKFPVGMDIYELGSYSFAKDEKAGRKRVREAAALEWAHRVAPDATIKDMKEVKVGDVSALFFTRKVPSALDQELVWRQWVFMVEGSCYFIVSTLPEELGAKLLPDVKKMVASFKPRKKKQDKKEPEERR